MEQTISTAKQVVFQGQGPAFNAVKIGSITANVHFDKYTQDQLVKKCFVDYPSELFTGREDELQQLHTSLHRNSDKTQITILSQTTIIVGLGGIGKTQLSRKYAQTYEDDHQYIIWINADTLRYSFTQVAKKLEITTCSDDTESIVENVYQHLAPNNCLFIFDNAECDEIYKFLPWKNYDKTYPIPYILITSRNTDWYEIQVEIVQLKELKVNEAIDFVQKGLEILDDDHIQDIKILVELLQFYPLAIHQAIAYIQIEKRKTNSKFTIGDYVERYQKQAAKLLGFNFKGLKLYGYTTITTCELSLMKIESNEGCGKTAMKILYIMGYLAPISIQRESLKYLTSESKDGIEELITAVNLLVQYSVVHNEWGGQEVISVHRVVQEVTRLRLKNQNEEEETIGASMKLLSDGFLRSESNYHFGAVWNHAVQYGNLIIKYYDRDPSCYYYINVDMYTALHLLIIDPNYKAIRAILVHVKNEHFYSSVINAQGAGGNSPLHLAAVKGHIMIAQLLIENHADINGLNFNLETPLHVALRQPGCLDIVKLLISNGAKINVVNKNGKPPLEMALSAITDFWYTVDKKDGKWLISANVPSGIVYLVVTDVALPFDDIKKGDDATNLLMDLKANRLIEGRIHVIAISVFMNSFRSSRREESATIQNLRNSSFLTFNYVVDDAIYREKLQVVEYLLENGADVNSCTTGMTPLILSCERNDLKICKIFLEKGANVNVATQFGYSPLHYAVKNNNVEMVKILLDRDAGNINDKNDNRESPLHIAAFNGESSDIVELLLEKGANQNTLNFFGCIPIECVLLDSPYLWDILKCFIKYGADPNTRLLSRTSLLHCAVNNCDLNAVRCLVEKGALIDAKDLLGLTPLNTAVLLGNDNFEIIKFLVKNGADFTIPSHLGFTPLQITARYCDFEILKCYGITDADVLSKKENYNMLCTPRRINKKYKELLGGDYPGDVDDEERVYFRKVLNRTKENVEHIEQYVNATDVDGNTPLFWAAHNGKPITAEVLLEYGADVNIKNLKNETALHWAVNAIQPEFVKLLIQSNINHTIKDSNRKTPFDIAQQMRFTNPSYEKIQEILEILFPLQDESLTMFHWLRRQVDVQKIWFYMFVTFVIFISALLHNQNKTY